MFRPASSWGERVILSKAPAFPLPFRAWRRICISLRQFAACQAPSNFRVQVEEGIHTGSKLLLDLLFAAFQDVHGNVCLSAILQLHRSFAHFCDLIRGQQAHSIYQRQISHTEILARAPPITEN